MLQLEDFWLHYKGTFGMPNKCCYGTVKASWPEAGHYLAETDKLSQSILYSGTILYDKDNNYKDSTKGCMSHFATNNLL